MNNESNEAAYSYWSQLFARQAESPWSTIVDPNTNFEEDKKKLRKGLLNAGWPIALVETLAAERADRALPSEGHNPGIANHVIDNFNRLCNDIEAELEKLGHKSHHQVARGIDPVSGPSAAMTPVMMTKESVISVSSFFFRYCGLIARATTRTLLIDHFFWEQQEYSLKRDRAKLRERPQLVLYWSQIMTSFAVTGTNIMVPYKPSKLHEVLLMEQIAYAMEIYTIAHEYGHHHIGHGRDITENQKLTEFEADAFAMMLSGNIEANQAGLTWNPYLGSGAGASTMLKSLELLRRHTEIITLDKKPDYGTHPEIQNRIKKFERLGVLEPKKFAAYISYRKAVTRIFNAVEAELIALLHIAPEEYLNQLREYHIIAHPREKPTFL